MMSISEVYQVFLRDIYLVTWQEWVSTIMQLASVWYARKNNIFVYPTGIIGVLLASWVYFMISSPPLYAEGVLNIYYFFMSVYGWYNWRKMNANDEFQYAIKWCTDRQLMVGILGFLIAWLLVYIMLTRLTNSDTPILDSFVSSTALTAMWWMSIRKIEHWLAWIISNLVAIPLNFYKGFMFFTLMYIVLLILAWSGFLSWKKRVT